MSPITRICSVPLFGSFVKVIVLPFVIEIEVVLNVLAPIVIVFVLALLVGVLVGLEAGGVDVLPPQAARAEIARANRARSATFFTEKSHPFDENMGSCVTP